MQTPKTLTVTECHQLLDALLHRNAPQVSFRKGIRNYTMALLMLDAGLRVGEVVALTISDLLYGGVPVENLTVRADIAKTKTERTIPLSDRLSDALKEMYPTHWVQFRKYEQVNAFVSGYNLNPLTTRQVERIIRSAAMKSIGRPVHPHILRHTFASRLMRKTNARIVQELLGHKHMTSTQIYTHPNQEDLKTAIEGIGEATVEETQPGIQKFSPGRSADSTDTT